MDSLLRAAAVYLFVLVIVRMTGRRSLAQLTIFDFVVLLIISEATQQALLGEDFSITNAALVITALIALDRVADRLSFKSDRVDRWLNGGALVLIENGHLHRERMNRLQIEEDDIMERARELQGIERLDEIKHAVLERTGTITVVPRTSR